MPVETVPRRVRQGLFALLGLIQATVLAGCGNGTAESVHVEPDSQRRYRLVKRTDHDARKPAPVLFALHPYATPSNILVDALSLPRQAAGARGYLLVVPEGASDAEGKSFWNASAACCGVGANRPDDVSYLRAVLDDVKRHFAVDSERVFAIGASNGGFMAHRWACDPRGDLRGVVSISAAGQGPDDPPCAAARPLRVLEIHGTEDETIRIEGGVGQKGRYPSAQETVRAWCKVADLGMEPERSDRYVFRLGTLRKAEWVGPRAKVALWTVEKGDHQLRGVARLTTELLDFLEDG